MRSRSVQIIAASALAFVVCSTPAMASSESHSSGERSAKSAHAPQIEYLLDNAEEHATSDKWLVAPRPTVNDYPMAATLAGVSGSATVNCSASSDGIIGDCVILEETPEGYGFGESAINIARTGRLVLSENGDPIRHTKMRFPFNLEEEKEEPQTAPSWVLPPRPIMSDYPRGARRNLISGSAVVACTATAQGVIQNCKVAEEQPANMGFGEAAVKIVERGRLAPHPNGVAYEGLLIGVPFNLD